MKCSEQLPNTSGIHHGSITNFHSLDLDNFIHKTGMLLGVGGGGGGGCNENF